MRLGGEVRDPIASPNRLVHGGVVTDVGLHDRALAGHAGDARAVPGGGEGHARQHRVVRVRSYRVVDEVGADESGTACDQKIHASCLLPSTFVDEANEAPGIDELVAQLRDRVEARRRSGSYPATLEEEMTAHFRRILHQRRGAQPLPDVQEAVRAAGQALPLQASRIAVTSGLPGGEMVHKAVAKLVSRQTQGVVQQVQAYAQPVQAALEALALAVSELSRTVQADVAQSLDAIYERQAAQ